jgi:hypothetical protein
VRVAGAKPPLDLPAWLGRLIGGEFAVAQMTTSRGNSNEKAKKGTRPAEPARVRSSQSGNREG